MALPPPRNCTISVIWSSFVFWLNYSYRMLSVCSEHFPWGFIPSPCYVSCCMTVYVHICFLWWKPPTNWWETRNLVGRARNQRTWVHVIVRSVGVGRVGSVCCVHVWTRCMGTWRVRTDKILGCQIHVDTLSGVCILFMNRIDPPTDGKGLTISGNLRVRY